MLRALKQLLRRGGRIAFTTIHIAPGLDAAAHRRARRSGPRAVASRRQQEELLASAGFVDIDNLDVTAEFATTARAWIEESKDNYDELTAVESPRALDERMRNNTKQLRAVEDGLLRRGMFTARRP